MNAALLKQSEIWKKEADKLLISSKLQNILKKFGEVIFSGSYSADLMMNGDIDIYVINKFSSKKKVLEIFNEITNFCSFEGYFFYDWKKNSHPNFPSAYYIGLKTRTKNNIKWKIDIWFLTKRDLQKIKYHDLRVIDITKEQKLTILKFKKYRNKFFQNILSTTIYDAVLLYNITTLKDFKKYIKDKFLFCHNKQGKSQFRK